MAKKEEDQSAKIAVQEALAKKLKEEQVQNYKKCSVNKKMFPLKKILKFDPPPSPASFRFF